MQFAKGIIKRLLKENEWFKMLQYFRDQYRKHAEMNFVPENFALFEEGAVIDPGVEIYHPERIVIRTGAVIHHGCLINAAGGLHLGRYSGISYNCTIFTGDHRFLKSDAIPFDRRSVIKPVYIEDFVMIGANVCIAPGVKIGEGAVVGIGTVVTKDLPPMSIVNGNPAAIVGYRDKSHFQQLKEKQAFQSPAVGTYEETIPLMYQRKYKDFFKVIGMIDK